MEYFYPLEHKKDKSFHFKSVEEVEKFDTLFRNYVQLKTKIRMTHIDNVSFYTKCNETGQLGLFYSLFDICINFNLIFIDLIESGGIISIPQEANFLDSESIFYDRMKEHQHISSFILRYRAILDKIMSVLVRMYAEDKHANFSSAKSRKNKFLNLCVENNALSSAIEHITGGDIDEFKEVVTIFDNTYRTAEAHGEGVLRKSFASRSFEESPRSDIIGFWEYLRKLMENFEELLQNFLKTNPIAPRPENNPEAV